MATCRGWNKKKKRKIKNNVIREKINIKISVLDYIRLYKIQTVKQVWLRAKHGPRNTP